MTEPPPLGIIPKHLWEERRMYDIYNAMVRYTDAGMSVPNEWVKEYVGLYSRYLDRVRAKIES